jgi:hypothetical protein
METRKVVVSKDIKDYLFDRITAVMKSLNDVMEEVSKWETEGEVVANGNS